MTDSYDGKKRLENLKHERHKLEKELNVVRKQKKKEQEKLGNQFDK